MLCIVCGIFVGFEDNWSVRGLVIIGLCTVASLLWAVGFPLYARYRAGQQYDSAVAGGYDFHGTVRVYHDRVEKECCGDVNTNPFDRATFLEKRDMMVFAVPGARMLLLPARCVTAADAEVLRTVVSEHIPPQRKLLRARMEAKAAVRIAPPAQAVLPPEEELLTFVAVHTPQIMERSAREAVSRRYVSTRPFSLALCAVLGAVSAVVYGFTAGVVMFIAALLVPWGMQVLAAGSRARRSAAYMDEGGLRMQVRLTTRGIYLTARNMPNNGFVSWKSVSRAVERRRSVEFIGSDGTPQLSLPIEAIGEHMQDLRDAVTAQLSRERENRR